MAHPSASNAAAPKTVEPSKALLTAALCGLIAMGSAAACSDGKDDEPGVAPTPDAGTGGQVHAPPDAGGGGEGGSETYNNVISEGVEITEAAFQQMCDERNGWVYVTAYCAGAGMCKGLSLLETTLTDHSCKGLNSCGGVGCVVLPEDTGLTGQEIYEDGPCGGCHGDWSDFDNPRFDVYTIVHGPDITSIEAEQRFLDSTDQRLISILVFGTMGLHADGTPFSNMPAYYQKYSLAEIRRALEHVKTLPTATAEYEIFGITPGFGIPGEGGAGGGGGGGG